MTRIHQSCRSGCMVPGPRWVPPLQLERRLFLSPRFNAFFKHGEAELLPRPARRPRGRAASAPRSTADFNDYHDNALGHVRLPRVRGRPGGRCGRCSTPPQAWLRERGRDRMVGPMDFTMNDECGVLIEGFDARADDPPALASALLPAAAARSAGLEKAMDLFMWELHIASRENDAADHLGARRASSSRSTAITHPADDAGAALRQRPATRSPRSTTRPGRATGASCRYTKEDLDAYAPGAPARVRPRLVHGRRDRGRRDGRRGDHGPRHQPGARSG